MSAPDCIFGFHLHLHLIPRYADSPGLRNLINPRAVESAELDAVLAQINGSTR